MSIRSIIRFSGVVLLLLLKPYAGLGQACCSGGTPLSSNLGVQGMNSQELLLDLTYDYNTQQTLVRGSEKLDDRFRKRNTHAVLLRGRYAISDRFALIGLFSWVRQEEDNTTLNGGSRFTAAQGISDIIALAQYRLWAKGGSTLVMALGGKIPFGKTNVLDPATELLLNADLQPSTGSFDGLGVVSFSHTGWIRPAMNFNLSFTYRLTSDYQRFDGLQTYRFGNEQQLYFGFNEQYVLGKGLINPQLMFRYRRTAVDLTDGVTTPNTGGQWLHWVPGLQYQLIPEVGINISGEIPLYRKLTGVQLTTSYRLSIGFSYRLSKKN